MGERHGAVAKAGSQKHASANTKAVDPVTEGLLLLYSLGDMLIFFGGDAAALGPSHVVP